MPFDTHSATHMQTRRSLPEDAAFLYALFAANCTHLHALGLPPTESDTLIKQQYASRKADYHRRFPLAETLIATAGKEPVGQMMVDDDSATLHLVDIAVTPSMHGRGYGGALVRQLLARAHRDRRQAVTLSVDPMNQGALRLYLALGFETVETHPVQWRMAWRPGSFIADEEARTDPLANSTTTKG